MKKNSLLPERKTPAHFPAAEAYNRIVIIFVTVCAHKRRALFASSEIHQLLIDSWHEAETWRVGRYIIMPNHIHLFCSPAVPDYPSLKKWVQYWKAMVSRKWPRPDEHPVWQKSFWDTQFRRGENYSEKWEYICHNPVRAGLCEQPEMWPHQGELNSLRWYGEPD